MKIVADGMKDGDFRFTCKKCSCVFDANVSDDGFCVLEETKERRMIPRETDDDEDSSSTDIVPRSYNVYDVTTTDVKCKCPSCGQEAFTRNMHYEHIFKFRRRKKAAGRWWWSID